jgi:CheY-like chemotaxis protein
MCVKTILVVDDENDIRYTVKFGLEGLDKNYQVVGVESGEKCFELLAKNQIPDLILLDIMMPKMNGWEVQRRLKENLLWRNIPVVFLTAVGDPTSKVIGSMTSKDCVEKPFKISELKKRLDKILNA